MLRLDGRAAIGLLAFALWPAHPAADALGAEEPGPSSRIVVKLRAALAGERAPVPGAGAASGTARAAALQGFLRRHGGTALRPVHAGRERARALRKTTDRQLASEASRRFPARARRRAALSPPDLSRSFVLHVPRSSAANVPDLLERLARDPDVEHAGEDTLLRAHFVPNDPYCSSRGSWGQPYADLYGLEKIGAAAAWEGARGAGVTVAVIDTGVDSAHVELVHRMWSNAGEVPGNAIDDDGNGYVDDVRGWDFVGARAGSTPADADPADGHGHGTHVAGTVAAEGDNGAGVVGVAWQARVMAVKGLDDQGNGYESQLASAIVYAADNGADVINASWGGPAPSQVLEDAVAYAASLGVVFVASAGNERADARDFVPAGFADVITVAASDDADALADFSNRGPRIDVAAPGTDILSLRAQATGIGTPRDALLTRLSGTSMAAPHVSGLAALVLGIHPDYSTEQVRQAIRASAVDLGEGGVDGEFGHGRIDAAQAVVVDGALEARIVAPSDGARLSGVVDIAGVARGAGFLRYELAHGTGESPSEWTTFAQGVDPVAGGRLGTLDTGAMEEGRGAIRLTVFDTAGRSYVDQRPFLVDWVGFTSPAPPLSPGATAAWKTGRLGLEGRATGPSFTRFLVEWARGINPESGWSAAGLALVGDGLAPVDSGPLASWDTSHVREADYYTLRLVVDNAASSTEARTLVYLEPDLLGGAWPRLLQPGSAPSVGAHPLSGPNGERMLTLATVAPGGGQLLRFAADGSTLQTIDTDFGGLAQPAVANLDGEAGDETVVGQEHGLRVFRGNGTSDTMPSPSPALSFHRSLVTIADLDGDATPEVLAVGVDEARAEAALVAWRADGTPLGGAFPVTLPNRNPGLDQGRPRLLVADLDGDGVQEIVVADGPDALSFSLRLLGPDGSRKPWADPVLGVSFDRLAVADLDGDGSREVLALATRPDGSCVVAALRADGSALPGWPAVFRRGAEPGLAVADLDGDGSNEVIVSAAFELHVLRADGQRFAGWPRSTIDRDYFGRPVAADTDGDALPEIVVPVFHSASAPWPLFPNDPHARTSSAALATALPAGLEAPAATELAASPASTSSFDHRLLVFRRDGSIVRSWRLLGPGGRQLVDLPVPTCADFDGDGRTDIAVSALVVAPGMRVIRESILTVLTTGAPHGAAPDPWPSVFHDAANSSLLATSSAPSTIVARVNAGGPAFVDSLGRSWTADGGFNTGNAADASASYPGPDRQLYGSERWDSPDAPELTYSFPVAPGTYTVRLYFAEIYSGAAFVGGRVFDVAIEGTAVLTDLDIYAEAGFQAPLVKTFTVEVTNGPLTIDFLHRVEHPKVAGIEILAIRRPPPSTTVVARVNAGGPAFVDSGGRSWTADAHFDTGNTADASASYPGADPPLYGTERWDPRDAPELTYSFPVEPGTYTVSLHFAEIYSGAAFVGGRVFDVAIAGTTVLDDLDVYAEVGFQSPLVKTFTVELTSGPLTIGFGHEVENPTIAGIEVFR